MGHRKAQKCTKDYVLEEENSKCKSRASWQSVNGLLK